MSDSVLKVQNSVDLPKLFKPEHQLALVERSGQRDSDEFFEKVAADSFTAIGLVSRENAERDVKKIVDETLATELQEDPFYNCWISDMADLCATHCLTQQTDDVCFVLSTERGCKRYHIDNVKMRLLVTYFGKGTEWILNEGADREAYQNGLPNQDILRDPKAVRFIPRWSVAVFRGEPHGFLHRTPDEAQTHPSVLMRLDHPSFIKNKY